MIFTIIIIIIITIIIIVVIIIIFITIIACSQPAMHWGSLKAPSPPSPSRLQAIFRQVNAASQPGPHQSSLCLRRWGSMLFLAPYVINSTLLRHSPVSLSVSPSFSSFYLGDTY